MKRHIDTQDTAAPGDKVERAYSDKGLQHIPDDYTAEDMRQGEIILKTRRERVIVGGIIGGAFLAFAIFVYNLVP